MTGYVGRHRAAPTRGRITRAVGALGLLGTTSIAAVMMLPASPAAAQAPDVAAWWNAANLGDPAPAPPPPPDVASGDLFVQGSNAGPAGTPLAVVPVTTQAVSAVEFDLPKDALADTLTLAIDGSAPAQVTVTACKVKEPFTSTENGPWPEVPTYDANACVPAALKGTSVEFSDVGKLAAPDQLSVLILPGPLDRVVFKAPGASSLTVTKGGGVGSAAPPIGTGTGSSSSGGNASTPANKPPVTQTGGSSGVVPPVGQLPGSGTTTAPGSVAPPVVASPDTTPTAAQPAATDNGLSTKDRRLIALLIIAAEVIGYVLLRRWPARDAAPAAGVAATAGGRLRPPDRPVSGVHNADAPGGVGRFRRERHGPVPHL